ncbi:uncharacterized protein A1O5_03928 [Cladophialophora psammophila CBS 110553]|uniref:Uncharacterized protein n=1 Tax=Cladophialophora psammophila CBS 110553 TaxID=1182543 RepID=W9X781_9EURO|nr:uncharacterized protein A1O5_03928 [Cladophialophora psammophila CBS 110553]EXJ72781.1 hypothetical protein A1O5_03928 [Cladophialophora psammophila CBS 110553]
MEQLSDSHPLRGARRQVFSSLSLPSLLQALRKSNNNTDYADRNIAGTTIKKHPDGYEVCFYAQCEEGEKLWKCDLAAHLRDLCSIYRIELNHPVANRYTLVPRQQEDSYLYYIHTREASFHNQGDLPDQAELDFRVGSWDEKDNCWRAIKKRKSQAKLDEELAKKKVRFLPLENTESQSCSQRLTPPLFDSDSEESEL